MVWRIIIILIREIKNREYKMIDQFKFLNPQALISIFGKIPKLKRIRVIRGAS